ncbi:YopX family protein [Campylobacter concisus]|jgi:hypothetical protein|uniref:YopX family protein n=1 Tax=Campylobacter concisus TaxID=199 RepID=UPI000CD9C847|nr:YopX family protein [Campylobacter concisus]
MRPRYRVWDKEEKKMIYDAENTYDSYPVNISSFGIILDLPNFYDVMQDTGLKDKDGKRIYAGDILTWGNNVIAEVYWADDLAMFRCIVEGTEEFDLFAFNQEASIIGNIHENKELLDE